MTRARFEYLINSQLDDEAMDRWGDDGWELVSVVVTDKVQLVYKREKSA